MRIRVGAIVLGTVVALGALIGFADEATPSADTPQLNPAQPVAGSYQPIRFGQPCPADQAIGISETGQIYHCGAWSDGRTLRWDN